VQVDRDPPQAGVGMWGFRTRHFHVGLRPDNCLQLRDCQERRHVVVPASHFLNEPNMLVGPLRSEDLNEGYG
jgi:hypothetical protein